MSRVKETSIYSGGEGGVNMTEDLFQNNNRHHVTVGGDY